MAFSYERWYMVDCYEKRDDAVQRARTGREKEEPGRRVWRVTKSGNSGRWCVSWAARMSASEMQHTRHFNRKIKEDSNGQRRLF